MQAPPISRMRMPPPEPRELLELLEELERLEVFFFGREGLVG